MHGRPQYRGNARGTGTQELQPGALASVSSLQSDRLGRCVIIRGRGGSGAQALGGELLGLVLLLERGEELIELSVHDLLRGPLKRGPRRRMRPTVLRRNVPTS